MTAPNTQTQQQQANLTQTQIMDQMQLLVSTVLQSQADNSNHQRGQGSVSNTLLLFHDKNIHSSESLARSGSKSTGRAVGKVVEQED